MSQLWVIAYDIEDDNIRRRIHDLLKDHGARVQYSVFECRLDNQALAGLRTAINNELAPADQVRWYPLCRYCQESIQWQGKGQPARDDGYFIP